MPVVSRYLDIHTHLHSQHEERIFFFSPALYSFVQERPDAFLLSNCRRTRSQAARALKESVHLYTQCRFCPVPRGDSQCDSRYYDAMRAGEDLAWRDAFWPPCSFLRVLLLYSPSFLPFFSPLPFCLNDLIFHLSAVHEQGVFLSCTRPFDRSLS